MALFDRITGEAEPGIPVHVVLALLGEFARGRVTGAQAQAALGEASGEPLDAAGVQEAQALLATVTGSVTARVARAKEVDDVLILAESRQVYVSAAQVKTRLGV